MKPRPLPSLEYLNQCFIIDLTSPSGLRWKNRPKHHFQSEKRRNEVNQKFAGKQAGERDGNYFRVKVKRKSYNVHRIIYALYNETTNLGELMIDHINRDSFDNRPENLRLVTNSENQKNRKIASKTSSCFPHVVLDRKWWRVCFRIKGKSVYFGAFLDIEDAKKVAREKSIELNGEFSPFLNGAFIE